MVSVCGGMAECRPPHRMRGVRSRSIAAHCSLKAKIEDEEYLSEAKSDEEREDRERELHETESRDHAYRYGSDHDAGDWEWDDDKEWEDDTE